MYNNSTVQVMTVQRTDSKRERKTLADLHARRVTCIRSESYQVKHNSNHANFVHVQYTYHLISETMSFCYLEMQKGKI